MGADITSSNTTGESRRCRDYYCMGGCLKSTVFKPGGFGCTVFFFFVYAIEIMLYRLRYFFRNILA